jgi:hypothetical protein
MTTNQRIRLEQSAASWNARASMLQSIDEDVAALKAKIRASGTRFKTRDEA